MLGFEALAPIAPAPAPAGDGLPVTPGTFPSAARQRAWLMGFPELRFKRAYVVEMLTGGVCGQSRVDRNLTAFVYAGSAKSRASEVMIGCAPLPHALETALRVWVVAMAVCDPSLMKAECDAAMLAIMKGLRPGGPSQIRQLGNVRCEAAWLPDTAVQLSIVPAANIRNVH